MLELSTQEFKQICSQILFAIDTSSNITSITDVLEVKTEDNYLYLNVTNREYYVSVRLQLEGAPEFRATVNAKLFLKLISQLTTEIVEIIKKDNHLNIKANGNYKLPLVFEGDSLKDLPKIEINNKTLSMNIPGNILNSIYEYNSRELIKVKKLEVNPVQKMYYIDQEGCITFTNGACINSFTLEKPVKMLLNNKLVKLFKLFGEQDIVKFTLGYDPLTNGIIQAKVSFETPTIKITSIISNDEKLLNSVPVDALKKILNTTYPYNITLDRNSLLASINRLMLFSDNKVKEFSFGTDHLLIKDTENSNFENIKYFEDIPNLEAYKAYLNISELKDILTGSSDQFINMHFGDNKTVLIVRKNIKNILPQYHQE